MVIRRKPHVAIIHSQSSRQSRGGEDLSVYLAVCLQLGGEPMVDINKRIWPAWVFLTLCWFKDRRVHMSN